MRWRRPRADPLNAFYTRAILASRTTLHISWRLVYRINALIEVSGRATAGAGLWHWVLPLFVLADIAQWQVLRRTDRLGLPWRLLADGVDIAFWSFSPLPPDGTFDQAVLLGVPLAAEAGVRLGSRGLVVPAFELAFVGMVRAVIGGPILPFTFLWLLLAVGVGWVLNAYCRRLHVEGEHRRSQVRDAEQRRAYVAGQNSIAMGASSVVDALESLVPVLGHPKERSALWQLAAGWKAELGKATRSQVVYLRDALGEWERRHNQHPDLSSRVELHVAEGQGTVMLTAGQARWLATWMDGELIRGPTPVSVVGDATARSPGGPVQVRVGSHTATVPGDRDAVPRLVDPGPVTFVFTAGQCLSLLSPAGTSDPPAVVAGMAGLCILTAWWAHRRLLRDGRAARQPILRAGIGLAVVLTIAGATFGRNGLSPNGATVYVGVGLILLGYLIGLYWFGLTRRQVFEAAAGTVACLVAAAAFAPGPHQIRAFVALANAHLVTFPTCRRISIALNRAGEEFAGEARAEDRTRVEAAFRDGRRSVLDLACEARDDALGQLHQVKREIDPALAALVSGRLEEVDRRLRTLHTGSGLSSSTTMS